MAAEELASPLPSPPLPNRRASGIAGSLAGRVRIANNRVRVMTAPRGAEETDMEKTRNEAERNTDTVAMIGVEFEGLRQELDAIKTALGAGDCAAATRAWTELDKRVQHLEESLADNPVVQRERRTVAVRQQMEAVFATLSGQEPGITNEQRDRFLDAAEAALEAVRARRETIETVTAVFKEAVAKSATYRTAIPAA
jgi:hypothetical protein